MESTAPKGDQNLSSYSVLRAEFVYREQLGTHSLAEVRNAAADEGRPNVAPAVVALGAELAASLAAKAAESLIDAAALRMQPEAVTLDITIPIEGFYLSNGKIAVDKGCLVFHDGIGANGAQRSILAVFQVDISPDLSAFRFTVQHWHHEVFLAQTRGWFQRAGERDFAIKIELLSPGSEGLGTRSVFVEHVFTALDQSELAQLFTKGQKLPWFALPKRPAVTTTDPGAPAFKTLPLNLRVTLVETTKPNQFAEWMQALAKEKKGEISALVKDSVRQAIDPSHAATQGAKLADAAGTAYAAYKTAWDDLSAHAAAKPKLPETATADQKSTHDAAMAAWNAKALVKSQALDSKRVVAKVAFDAADLPWPGNLPEIKAG